MFRHCAVVLGVAFLLLSCTASAAPVVLGPAVNSSSDDGSPSVSADGLTMYFKSDRPGGFGESDLYQSTRASIGSQWGPAVNLGPVVNSDAGDGAPCISSDGLTLYFDSKRGGGWADLWQTTRASTMSDWGAPVSLGSVINSSSADFGPSISSDGLTLYFASSRVKGADGNDLFQTTRASVTAPWSAPTNLGLSVNSLSSDWSPTISPDGLTLFFGSNRAGGFGGYDLWQTSRASLTGPWGPATNLGPLVNTAYKEGGLAFAGDGSLLFSSDRPGGYGGGDIWETTVTPEPSTLALLAIGAVALAAYAWRRRARIALHV